MENNVVDIVIPMPWGSIAGKTFGKERATPVLCVHGRSDNLESFSHLIQSLPHNNYYVCIDLPGHGKSSHAHKGYILDLMWYTMSVKRVIDHFKWSKLSYLGHSLGGQIGFILAALYPELLLKLVVIDILLISHISPTSTAISLRNFLFDPTLRLEKRSSVNHAPVYSLAKFIQKMKEVRKTEVTDEQIRTMAKRNLKEVGPDQYKYSNDQRTKLLGNINFCFEQLASISNNICCPVLVILGKNSRTTIPQDRLKHSPLRNNSNVTFKIIEGDHDVHIARTQQVAQLIVPFLSGDMISKL